MFLRNKQTKTNMREQGQKTQSNKQAKEEETQQIISIQEKEGIPLGF
jgi:hypothetical protein